jgi:hypothetical protein
MHETEILQRVSEMASRQPKVFRITESMSMRQLHRLKKNDGFNDLKSAYITPSFM